MFFFFHPPSPTDIYTLSLHDALPICFSHSISLFEPFPKQVFSFPQCPPLLTFSPIGEDRCCPGMVNRVIFGKGWLSIQRSEEHTSELQSRLHLVCRLLLEKKNNKTDS